MEFGLNEILGIIILVISVFLLISEIRTKKATDMVTNIVIAALLMGVSLYNLIKLGFTKDSIILTITYIIVALIGIAFIILFVLHHFKYKNSTTENNDSNE